MSSSMTPQQIVEQVASRHLGIEHLAPRNSDRLDFHDLAVWRIEAALKAAFEAGRASSASLDVGFNQTSGKQG